MESPDVLFCPSDAWIQTPVPAPLMLFQCIRFPLRGHYESDDAGLLVKREDRFQENTLVFPDGSRFTSTVSASDRFGLPNAFDVDHFLGVLRIADEQGHEADGRLPDVTYARIINARDPGASQNADKTDAVKRMLQRFGNTTVTANFQKLLGPTGDRAEEENAKWILEYDRASLQIAGNAAHVIRSLKINPFWLRQTEEGKLTSWIDVDIHNRQTQPTGKMAYLRLAIAAAQGQLDAYRALSLEEWEEVVNAASSEKQVERANRLRSALDSLVEAAVLERSEMHRTGKGRATRYTFHLEPGPVLKGLRRMERIGRLDPPRTRALLWHLQHLGLAEGEARSQLSRHGMRVQEVLQRVHYEKTEKRGLDAGGRPIARWRQWVLKALEEGWRFEEPEYDAWLERQKTRFSPSAAPPALPAAAAGTGAEGEKGDGAAAAEEPPRLADNLWGQAIERARPRAPLSGSAVRLLAGCWLEEVSEEVVRIGARDAGTAAVVEQVYARHLLPELSGLLGREVGLQVQAGDRPSFPSP